MKGVRFGDIHSYDDLGLVLGQFSLSPATPQLNFLKIPGRNGYLDLTEANGGVNYNSREFTFTFTAVPGFLRSLDRYVYLVEEKLHGKRFPIILDRDPDKRWDGRCVVDKYEQDKTVLKVIVKAIVNPFAQNRKVTKRHSSDETTMNIAVTNETIHNVNSVEVSYSGTGRARILFDNQEWIVWPGTTVLDVCLDSGVNIFEVTFQGDISITWWEEGVGIRID